MVDLSRPVGPAVPDMSGTAGPTRCFRPISIIKVHFSSQIRAVVEVHLVIDALEPRRLLSLSLALSEGTLTVGGTLAADTIVVSQIDDNFSIAVNKSLFMMPASEVQRITIKGFGGNDKISFGDGVNIPATIFGGDGNDLISGGSRSNRLSGD